MKCRIILELLAILFFTGCYNREQISRLDEAEALLQNKPDSALTILQQLKSEGSQAEQARYALLYSEALDKNHIKATNDSLIRRAWEYYKHHPKDLRRQCKTLYYWGKVKLRAGDKPGALRLYLKVEEKLKDTNEPYYAGLLYSQIGEVPNPGAFTAAIFKEPLKRLTTKVANASLSTSSAKIGRAHV